MKISIKEKRAQAVRRANRVRSRVFGTAAQPRLSVFRSLKHIYAQIINDDLSKTLVAVSDASIPLTGKPNERAVAVGRELAKLAVKAGITQVVFDRGSYRYHGRVASLAQGAREGGLKF